MKYRTRVFMGMVALGAMAFALVGCASTGSTDPAALEGTWALESFGGAQDLKAADPTVATNMTMEAEKASGNGGVNSYSATYETPGDNALTFSPPASTMMAGEAAAMEQEAAFFAALEKTEHFEINEGKLVLSDAGNNTIAVLKPQ